MLKVLVKTRMTAYMQSMFGAMSKGRKKRGPAFKVLVGLFAVYVVGMIAISMGLLLYSIAQAFVAIGLNWLYFSYAAIMAFMLSIFGTVFTAEKQLFDATDNELLLSMPIKPSHILASRIIVLLMLEYAFNLLIMIPTIVVYGLVTTLTAANVIAFVMCVLLLPLLSLAVCCAIGFVVGLISSRMRHKNMISTVLVMAFFGAYMVVCFNMQNVITTLVSNGEQFAKAVSKVMPFIYSFGVACAYGDFVELLKLAAWCIIPMAAVCFFISKNFIKIATTKKGLAKVKYTARAATVGNVRSALLKKELKRFFSLPTYVLNTALGALMQFLFAGYVLFKGDSFVEIFEQLPSEIATQIPLVAAAALCFCAIMNCSTSSSLSLEGQGIYILKSMPIAATDLYRAKINVNLLIGLPFTVFSGVVIAASIGCDAAQFAGLVLLPCSVQVFAACFGMVANVLFPRFEWLNEVYVIKQGVSTMISVLGGMGLFVGVAVLYVLVLRKFLSATVFMYAMTIVFLVASLACWLYLQSGGKKRYNEI
ncbi:MAG: hypothetical protein RSG78_03085 [Oscillospiraceae bacterium]